jgi:Fur family ferric uptake transcriptional regulator
MLNRNTRQKDAIRTAFMGSNRPLSPEEVYSAAQKHVKGISMATVYRNLGLLVAESWLSTVEVPGDSARYEVAGKEHHHHFQCDWCGKMFDMPGCGIQTRHKLPRGFRVTRHEFFLYGHCAECA